MQERGARTEETPEERIEARKKMRAQTREEDKTKIVVWDKLDVAARLFTSIFLLLGCEQS